MPLMSGAQAAIATLRAHGVTTIFGIPGVHTLPLYDALRDEPGIRHVLARHEQGAGFMADGYARASGAVGVACVITGPGVTNAATPLADAYADSVPVLLIATSLPRGAQPRGDLHELKEQHGVMESLVGWTRAITSVEEIPEAIRDAFGALRTARPRGAYLEIPLDLLAEEADLAIPTPLPVEPPAPDAATIARVAALLGTARCPIIVAGAGVTAAGANDALARLALRLGAPVLLGAKSRAVLPDDFPLAVAASGYGLARELVELAAGADVALVVGSKLGDQRTGQGRLRLPASLIHIDVDAVEIGRRYPATIGVHADARLALEALVTALSDVSAVSEDRREEVAAVRNAVGAAARRSFGPALDYLDAIRAALPVEGILVADMTVLGYASADCFPVYGPRTFIHAAELCTIGCGLPLALGAKVASPDAPVVALCGDGGFLLNAGELATAAQEQIPIVVVVFNDRTYTAVKHEQRRRYGGRFIATDLQAPDYVALARAFGFTAERVAEPAALGEALSAALAGPAMPTLIEVTLPAEA